MFDVEHHRRLTLKQRTGATPVNIEFCLEPRQGGNKATVIVSPQRTYFEWSKIRTSIDGFVRRLVDGWRLAAAGEVPTPASPRSLLTGPIDDVQEQSLEAEIQAPIDVIWELVEDVDAPDQWRQRDSDGELFFIVSPGKEGRPICTLWQIIRHSPFHVTVRGPAYEVDHELIPGAVSHLLRITHRWENRHSADRNAPFARHRAYLDGIKALAEAQPAG